MCPLRFTTPFPARFSPTTGERVLYLQRAQRRRSKGSGGLDSDVRRGRDARVVTALGRLHLRLSVGSMIHFKVQTLLSLAYSAYSGAYPNMEGNMSGWSKTPCLVDLRGETRSKMAEGCILGHRQARV